jgi:hypothetical protein
LTARLEQAQKAIEDVRIARANYDNEVNHRRQVFDALPRLAAGILRLLEASGAAPEKLNDARSFVHILTGKSPERAPLPSEAVQEQGGRFRRSVLQLAYVSRADSFSHLVQSVQTEPLYGANEKALSLAGLGEKVEELNRLNERVSEAALALSNARIRRNELMYTNPDSLLYTARAVKKYVRGVYGPRSERYAQIKSMVVTKPPKR